MRPGGKSADAETVSRRLELLGDQLRSTLPAPDEHTHIRPGGPADPWRPTPAQPAASPDPVPEVPSPGRHAARRRRPGRMGPVDLSAVHGRIGLSAAHVAVLAVLVAVGLAVTTWWVVRDDPGDPVGTTAAGPLATPVGTGSSGSAGTGQGGQGAGGGDQGAGDLVVDVTGKVRRPGIVVLDPGSRVVDALEAAGGAKPGVSLVRLNLARPLTDGEQIVVGIKPPPGMAATTAPRAGGAGDSELVDINTASRAELEELSGVGPVTAEAIIEWRTSHGGFQSVDQLLDVDGIGEKTLADLSPHVTIG